MKKDTRKPKKQGAKKNRKSKNKKTKRRIAIKIKYITRVENLEQLSEKERGNLKKVSEKFAFRTNDYYLSLIDWNDPDDPIRRIIIPDTDELEDWGRLDPSNEESYTIIPGLEHKYSSTALMLVSCVCDGICRYCFRKRVFIDSSANYLHDIPTALEYIKAHTEITNVLLTGGDPFMLATAKLENIVKQLRQIEHVQIIRIGTKVPVFNPYRVIEDPSLLEMIDNYSTENKKIYIMTHFSHPRELTDVAIKAVNLLQKAGAMIANQCPLIRRVNDDPHVLAELLAELSFIGAVPYYIFQCRPAIGNRAYTVPIETGYTILEEAKKHVSGLAKRIRFVMSHSSGKIEVVGKTQEHVYFRYHRAAQDKDSGRFMALRCNPQAYWLDDYDEIIRDYPITMPYRSYGPE